MFSTGVGGRCTYFRYVFIQDIQGILPVAHPFQCVSCLQYIVVVVCVRQKGKCNINSGKSTMYDESMANSRTYISLTCIRRDVSCWTFFCTYLYLLCIHTSTSHKIKRERNRIQRETFHRSFKKWVPPIALGTLINYWCDKKHCCCTFVHDTIKHMLCL